MSELEHYFERLQTRTKPKSFTPSPMKQGCTNWPNVDITIREVMDEFTDCQGYKPTASFTIKQWEAGARDFVSVHGENPKLLREAWEFYLDIEWEKRQNIVITTPRSLIGFATKILEIRKEEKKRDPDSRENRDKYLRGWWDE